MKMDFLDLINTQNWISLTFVLLICLYVYLTWNHGIFKSMGIPGPPPVPLFGNMLPEFKRFVPDLDLEYAKKFGKVYGIFEGTNPVIRIADPELIREICIDKFDSFMNHSAFEMKHGDQIFNSFLPIMKGEQWKQTRKVISPAFSAEYIKQLTPLVHNNCQKLLEILDDLARRGENFDIRAILVNYLLDVIASCSFGMEVNAQQNQDNIYGKYVKKFESSRNFLIGKFITLLPRKLLKHVPDTIFDFEGVNFFREVVFEIIRFRKIKNQRRNDFLQQMLDSLDESQEESLISNPRCYVNAERKDSQNESIKDRINSKGLSPTAVVAQSLLFLIVGFEKVAHTMSLMCYLLAKNTECQEKLFKEIDQILATNDGKINSETIAKMHYMDMVIWETLRMYPPAIRINRECNKTCQINGLLIPEGTVLELCTYAVLNNEAIYPNPKVFNPERFSPKNMERSKDPFAHLSFGIGPRNCIGKRFAEMKMKITLANILKDFSFACAPESQAPLRFENGFPGFLARNGIHLLVKKRNSGVEC